ncbi:MAG: division/cell wall cluster transcriptional repressor MraZ [Bacteroidales bacterium]|jgi:MraZ protein|nr:division/cell wall cluster transcriptional repressor MraZ [Bacteroidales bacterium]
MFTSEGSYLSTLDRNGRFQLPTAILRNVTSENDGRFVVNRSTEKCLTLYPLNVWNVYKDKLNHLNSFKPGNRQAIRYFMGSATEVKLDAKNRLLIPKPLSQYALLEKELLIVGMTSFIEIWDPKQYEEELNRFSQENPEVINEIANHIFGDGEFNKQLP